MIDELSNGDAGRKFGNTSDMIAMKMRDDQVIDLGNPSVFIAAIMRSASRTAAAPGPFPVSMTTDSPEALPTAGHYRPPHLTHRCLTSSWMSAFGRQNSPKTVSARRRNAILTRIENRPIFQPGFRIWTVSGKSYASPVPGYNREGRPLGVGFDGRSLFSDCRQGSMPASRRFARTALRVFDCLLAPAFALLWGPPFLRRIPISPIFPGPGGHAASKKSLYELRIAKFIGGTYIVYQHRESRSGDPVIHSSWMAQEEAPSRA